MRVKIILIVLFVVVVIGIWAAIRFKALAGQNERFSGVREGLRWYGNTPDGGYGPLSLDASGTTFTPAVVHISPAPVSMEANILTNDSSYAIYPSSNTALKSSRPQSASSATYSSKYNQNSGSRKRIDDAFSGLAASNINNTPVVAYSASQVTPHNIRWYGATPDGYSNLQLDRSGLTLSERTHTPAPPTLSSSSVTRQTAMDSSYTIVPEGDTYRNPSQSSKERFAFLDNNLPSREYFSPIDPRTLHTFGTLLRDVPAVNESASKYPTIKYDANGTEHRVPSIERFDHINADGGHQAYGTILRSADPKVEKVAMTYRTIKATAPPPVPLPTNFDGRVVWKGLLTPVGNQGSCGNCWAYATSYVLADRYAILSLGQIKFIPSPTELAECAHKFGEDIATVWGNIPALKKIDDDMHANMSCNGASLYDAVNVLYTDGVPDINCFPDKFSSAGTSYDLPTIEDSTKLPYCYMIEGIDFDMCADGKTASKKYRSQTAYNIAADETSIMIEIYRWGPVAVGIMIYPDFMYSYDGKSIYTHPDTSGQMIGGHAVVVVGWGETVQNGATIKYWIIRNSWGTDWGDGGYFKMQRGITDVQLEKNVVAMLPDFPGMTIVIPDLIPIETTTDIDVHKFTKHYIDPVTGYYTSGLGKIGSCALTGNALPYINPVLALPDYTKFWSYDVAKYISQLPNPLPSPAPAIASCGTPYVSSLSSSTTDSSSSSSSTSNSSPTSSSPTSSTTGSSSTTHSAKSIALDISFGIIAIGGATLLWKYLPVTDQSDTGSIGNNYLPSYTPSYTSNYTPSYIPSYTTSSRFLPTYSSSSIPVYTSPSPPSSTSSTPIFPLSPPSILSSFSSSSPYAPLNVLGSLSPL